MLFIVLAIAGVLKVKQHFFDGPKVPTANVPSVSLDDIKPTTDNLPPTNDQPADTTPPPNTEPVKPVIPIGPSSYNLSVPFTSQAPTGNWDALHEDACEEASMYMVTEFYAGNTSKTLDPAVVDPILKDMVTKETAEGIGPSATAAEIVAFMKSDLGVTGRIVENPSVDDLKLLLVQGYPIIVPAAGRELGNPFFTGEGPLYHMLVIRGYTADTFITNDPGTRHGENYSYSTSVLMSAIGDWNGGDPANGASRVIVIEHKK